MDRRSDCKGENDQEGPQGVALPLCRDDAVMCYVFIGHALVSETPVVCAITRRHSRYTPLPHIHSLPPSLLPPISIVPVAANNELFYIFPRRSEHDDVGQRQVEGKGGEDYGLEGAGADVFEY